MSEETKEKKVPIRSLLFNTEEEALNRITEKEYEYPDDLTVQEVQTELPTKVRVQLQGKTVVGIGYIPVAKFDLSIFTPKEDETEEETTARMKMAQKTVELIDTILEKESLRLAKADALASDFESFLDNLTATRTTVEITVKETNELIKEWLRANNAAAKEHKKPIFFDSQSKLAECIKSRASSLQFFSKSAADKVDLLLKKYYEMLRMYFAHKEKSTAVLDKWWNNRTAGTKEEILLDNLDDLI
jgi:hypothetical protein